MTPFFVSFEGLDGSGKDSILNAIFSLFYDESEPSPLFLDKHQNVLRTREPTLNSSAGRKIDKGLSSGDILGDSKKAAELFIKDRLVHCKFIRQALKNQTIVLSSRYDLSTYAYQMTQGVDFDWMYKKHLYGEEHGCLIPDVTLFFHVSPEVVLQRKQSRQSRQSLPSAGDMFNKLLLRREVFEDEAFLRKTFEHYKTLINLLPQKDGRRIAVIDAHKSIAEVTQEVVAAIGNYLKESNHL